MRALTTLAFVLATALNVSASPITYIHTGSGSGTLDGSLFGSAAPLAFTITAVGDTDNVESCGGPCLFNDNISASIEIFGLGTFDFITPTRYFANGGGLGDNIFGLSRAGFSGSDLFNGDFIGTWDMVSSIGPLAGTAELLQWGGSFDAISTSGGVLIFNSASTDSTFTAIVGDDTTAVPEPATLLLLGTGLAAAGIRRRQGQRE